MLTSYPGLAEHRARIAQITKDHWRQFETNADHAERVDRAETEAYRLFRDATKHQLADRDGKMADLAGLDAPKYDRARKWVEFDYHRDTAKARELLERSLEDLMRDSEVSQETYALWQALEAASIPFDEALRDPKKARALFDASKGGGVRGITEDHRYQLAHVFQAREVA